SEIAKSIDVTLDASVDEEACPYDLAPSASTTVAMAIGDALALTTMKVKQFTPEHFAESHPLGQLGRNLTLRVSDVMKSNDAIPVVTADKTFYDSLIVMTEKQLGCVCIVNEKNELIGIITDGDVRRILQTTMNLHEVVVSQVMTKNPIVVEQTMLVGKALEIMEKRNTQISVLPVVHPEDKSVVGIVRIHDLLHIH
ncbi:MAG: CBS domain-containing protein, partial [Candidatus Kapabacteria bacterium]|nr:CBS domain-containing protein [Candidatus Kapabacteria bacterium]